MRPKTLFITCALASSLFSQTTIWEKDKFTGQTFARIECGSPKLEGGSLFTERYVSFRIWDYISKSHNYRLQITVRQPNWIFIEGGESLIFKIDDEFTPLSGDGSRQNRDVASGGISEYASYDVSRELLDKIATSKETLFRLSGSQGSITGELTPKMRSAIARFISETQQPVPLQETIEPAPPTQRSGTLKAGISFIVGSKFLQVVKAEPWSKAQGLIGQFIVAVEGMRGTGADLQTLLQATISKKQGQDDKVHITTSAGPGEPELETELTLAVPK